MSVVVQDTQKGIWNTAMTQTFPIPHLSSKPDECFMLLSSSQALRPGDCVIKLGADHGVSWKIACF